MSPEGGRVSARTRGVYVLWLEGEEGSALWALI